MSDNGKHFYESMFILDARSAKKDYDGLQAELVQILNKHEVEVAQTHKWGERRLAYEIRRQKKGYYVLMHLKAEPGRITDLKKDLNLFEPLLRQFYLRIDAIPEKFEFPAEPEDRRDGRRIGRRDGPPPRGDYHKRPGERSREGADSTRTEAKEEKPAAGAESPESPASPASDAREEKPTEGAESPGAEETPGTEETVETGAVAVAPEDGAGEEKVLEAPPAADETLAPEPSVPAGETEGADGDQALPDAVKDENQGKIE